MTPHRQALLGWLLGAAVFACTDVRHVGGGAGLDLPLLDVVFQCDLTDLIVDQRGSASAVTTTYEWCFNDSAVVLVDTILAVGLAREATCYATPRHAGVCYWCCGDGCPARGSNALNGQFCWSSP